MYTIIIILLSLAIAIEIITFIIVFSKKSSNSSSIEALKAIGDGISNSLSSANEMQKERLEQIQKSVSGSLGQQELRFKTFESETREKLESIRSVTEKQLWEIRNDNSKRLDEMRQTVDEKLQKTLEDKMNESFRLVSERLEQVYKGLGEMQTLAAGVGDLKKVLSNVKSIFKYLQACM